MTFFSSVIGLLALLIAYQQWRLNRERLRLELFEKRYRVYKATSDYVGNVSIVGDPEVGEQWRFRAETADATFLFNQDVSDYLQTIRDRSDELDQHIRLKDTEGEDQEHHEQEANDLCCWFHDQLIEDALPNVFAPYLKFQDLEDPAARWISRALGRWPLRRNDHNGR